MIDCIKDRLLILCDDLSVSELRAHLEPCDKDLRRDTRRGIVDTLRIQNRHFQVFTNWPLRKVLVGQADAMLAELE